MSDHTKPLMKSLISNKYVLGGNILVAPKFWSEVVKFWNSVFQGFWKCNFFMTLYDRRLFV